MEGMDFNQGHNRISGDQRHRLGNVTYRGVVKSIDKSKGYGFIDYAEVHAHYGCDVFVQQSELRRYQIGDHVQFSLKENAHGQPQGRHLESVLSTGYDVSSSDHVETSTNLGQIKLFDAARGFGFISCKETFDVYGRDVFVHKNQIGQFVPGDLVCFLVMFCPAGRVQAYNLSTAPEIMVASEPCKKGDSSDDALTNDTYLGNVKSLDDSKQYGFIECAVTRKRFGRDVFFPKALLPGVTVGEQVKFQIRSKNGQPQAHSAVRVAKEAKVDVSMTKKLLRACASARKESYQDMFHLLDGGANPNGRDVTGQTALMIAALSTACSEKKCRLLVGMGADVHAIYQDDLTVLRWSCERISPRFADHLERLARGEVTDCHIVLDTLGCSEA